MGKHVVLWACCYLSGARGVRTVCYAGPVSRLHVCILIPVLIPVRPGQTRGQAIVSVCKLCISPGVVARHFRPPFPQNSQNILAECRERICPSICLREAANKLLCNHCYKVSVALASRPSPEFAAHGQCNQLQLIRAEAVSPTAKGKTTVCSCS